MNQLRITARDPVTGATSSVVVNRPKWERADYAGHAGLTGLLQRALLVRGATLETAPEYTAELVGPQFELTVIAGGRL